MSENQKAKQARVLKDSFREMMKDANTSIPGHVKAFDPATQLAQIQIGIERTDLNGAITAPATIIEVPVHFPGDDWCVEYQIDPGCEGLIHFSQRCIDGWLQSGGVAPNPIARFHDKQDAFFVPGFRPLSDVLPAFQNNGIRLRNKAGTQFAWLKNDNSIVVENGAGHIRLGADGIVTINGVTFTPAGLVTTAADVVAAGISLTTHVHSGVQSGLSNTGGPV
ncbi:MAG: Gp138 family membrane-puncturing spike protein [Pyrinomonadaceae bacterium]